MQVFFVPLVGTYVSSRLLSDSRREAHQGNSSWNFRFCRHARALAAALPMRQQSSRKRKINTWHHAKDSASDNTLFTRPVSCGYDLD
jgi:hypothetical protein